MNTARSLNPFLNKSEDKAEKQSSKMPKVKLSLNTKNLVGTILYVVSFILPFFFLPFTFDVLVLNKTYLVIVVALLMLSLQVLAGLLKEDYKLNTIENYFGIIGILLAGALATVYSTNRAISLYGSVQNYNNSFLFLVGLSVLAFVISNDRVSLKKLLLSLGGGSVVATLVSIPLFFNLNILKISGVFTGFSFVGAMTEFKLLELLSSVVILYYLSTKQIRGKLQVTLASIGWFLSSFAVLVFGDLVFTVLYILFTGIVLVYVVKKAKTGDYVKRVMLPTLIAIVLATGLVLIPTTRKSLNVNDAVSDPRLTNMQAWNVSASVIKEVPLTGSGLGTFLTDASMYKPVSLNATDFWNNRFSSAPSDLLLVLSTMGVVGMVLYLFFWFWLFRSISRIDKRDGKFLMQLVGSLLLIGSLFFGLGIVTWFVTFVIAGLSIKKSAEKQVEFKTPFSIGFILLLSIVAFGLILYQAFFVYKAQYHFRKAVMAEDYVTRYQEERNAIEFDKKEGYYRQQNINTAMAIALILSKDETSDKDQVSRFVESAVFESRVITEYINPNNSSYWETRAFVYGKLIGVVKDVEIQVIESASNAVKLDPVNPRLWLSLGNYYYAVGDKNNAANSYAKAVQLKNDYANAHYNLAQVLADLKAYKDALVQMQITARLVEKNADDLKAVNASIDKLNEIIESAKAESTPATVTSDIPIEPQLPELVGPTEGTQEALSEPGVGEEEVLAPGTEITGVDTPVDPDKTEEAPLAQPPVSIE